VAVGGHDLHRRVVEVSNGGDGRDLKIEVDPRIRATSSSVPVDGHATYGPCSTRTSSVRPASPGPLALTVVQALVVRDCEGGVLRGQTRCQEAADKIAQAVLGLKLTTLIVPLAGSRTDDFRRAAADGPSRCENWIGGRRALTVTDGLGPPIWQR